MTDKVKNNEDLAEGSLMSHLFELRNRLFIVVGSVFGVFLCLIPFSQQLLTFAAEPLTQFVASEQLQAIKPISPLTAQISLAFYIALFIAMPIVLYQVWAFVAPGLYRKEKRFASPLFISSILLFYAGLAFAYFVVLPLIFGFIASFAAEIIDWKPDIAEYISFVMMIILVFGVAFETPVATVLTVWTGLTTPEKLGKARPYVFLGAFVIGMLLTPPDVISQTILAIPVYLLFELGIIMSKFLKSGRIK
ncbi:MAG: twin-arginine translocase subunit TatC [Gammaproteobacteria bacterium]|jgi:sec-independent protein translocase protein TatC|nr:twin-arginine translocase subunit TatC [Gammaproteobacteria bacterium]